jgi:putative membrane protein
MPPTLEQTTHRTLREYVGIAARGFCMGAADVVPGVSGGTMAFILGIYEELLHAIHSINLDFVRRLLGLRWREAFSYVPWRFLLALGLGIGAAIFTLAESISWALHHHPSLVWAFFFGLVLASIIIVRKRVRRWTPATILSAGLAAVGAFLLVGMAPAQTSDAPWFLFLSGALAICAMILPGISGAFILVLLGKYQDVLDAVVIGDVTTLAIVAGGCVVGLLSFARLLRWLFQHYHDVVVATLMGLMLGSLRKVWPWKETQTFTADPGGIANVTQDINVLPTAITPEVGLIVGLMLLGVGLILGMERLNARWTVPATTEVEA